MDLKLFDKLMELRPSQHEPEFQTYLEICEMYMKKLGIKKPLVVELGTYKNRQKRFYEQLLGAEHIGVDIGAREDSAAADIIGNTHDPETMATLKKKLRGRSIDILFIDACHRYDDVKKDYEMYSPLCNGIVAFHDIERKRHKNIRNSQVFKYWDELLEASFSVEKKGLEPFLYLPVLQCHQKNGKSRRLGIGMIIKRQR